MKSKITKTLLFAFVISLFTALTVFSASAATVTHKKLVYEIKGKAVTLVECKSNAKKITVPSKVGKYKVTVIGKGAFSEKKKLKSVILPSSVKKISQGAFSSCTSLESVVIPKSVKTIGKNIFGGSEKVTAYVVKGSKGEKYIKKQKKVKLAYRYMTSLTLSVKELSLTEGETASLKVNKKPQKLYNSKVKFSSDSPEVVSVDAKGVLTAKKEGKAVITCTARDGSKKKATCTVTVTAKKTEKPVTQTPSAPAVTDKVTVPDTTVQPTVPAPKGPEKVAEIRAEDITCTSCTLVWTGSSLNSGYIISRYDAVNEKWTDIYDVTESSFILTGLVPDSESSYRVTAYTYEKGAKVYADASDAVTVKTAVPSSVKKISVVSVSESTVTLTWDKAENATGYKVYLYDAETKEYTYMYTCAEAEITVSGLESATEYTFAVKSCYSDGRVNCDSKAYSQTASAKTLPGRVEEIRADDIYYNSLSLSWDAVEGAEGYNLYLYNKESGEYELYASFTEPMAEITDLTPDTGYIFKIKTFILGGEEKTEGAFSKEFIFTTEYLPSLSLQVAQDFIDGLYNMQSETASYSLMGYFEVTDAVCDKEGADSIISAIAEPSMEYYTVSEGKDINGTPAEELIWPLGRVSDITASDIDNGTLEFTQDGIGYDLEFTLDSEKAFVLARPTDFDSIKAENEGFELISFEAQDGTVEAKLIDGNLSFMTVEVPVTAVFTLGGERYEISYTLSQNYF